MKEASEAYHLMATARLDGALDRAVLIRALGRIIERHESLRTVFRLVDDVPMQIVQPGAMPFDYVNWGATVYPGWQAVDQAALALIESTPLFMLPGRRCENGRPAPIDRADYKQFTDALVQVAREAYKASQTRNQDTVIAVAEKLNDACANCHKVYRDSTQEGLSSGAKRCL